ncbi:MAG: peptide-methionine (S)-S-oxide reductase MsrA [Cyanobacteria bacterium]|nr:peptide-methionine (S)-S-oxide reductase MsrA [Cyanobacteriota bacterium]
MSQSAEAMFGAGCFWGVEDDFRALPGVLDAAVGYAGGHTQHPNYREVCSGQTGHAEVVYLTYDPDKISYTQLLEAFWAMHDPTTLNRQGPDVGTQYRSVIFTYTSEQAAQAVAVKQQLEEAKRFSRPIVTEIVPSVVFYKAEEYHQQYNVKNGRSCHI